MMTEYIALPLKTHEMSGVAGSRRLGIVDNKGWLLIGHTPKGMLTKEEAHLIVTACNCHAELLWACKIARRWLKERGYTMGEALTALDIAIRNAEEQTR